MKLDYKSATIVLVIILVLVLLISVVKPRYDNSIASKVETSIAMAQTQSLQFLWYTNNETIVVTAQQLYLYFQQLEQQQTGG